jgi:hypothetical protein
VSCVAPCGLSGTGLKKSFMLGFFCDFFCDSLCGFMFTGCGNIDGGVGVDAWHARARFRPRARVHKPAGATLCQAAASLTNRHGRCLGMLVHPLPAASIQCVVAAARIWITRGRADSTQVRTCGSFDCLAICAHSVLGGEVAICLPAPGTQRWQRCCAQASTPI